MERKPDWLPGLPVQIYCNRRTTMKYFTNIRTLDELREQYAGQDRTKAFARFWATA